MDISKEEHVFKISLNQKDAITLCSNILECVNHATLFEIDTTTFPLIDKTNKKTAYPALMVFEITQESK